MPRGRRRLRNLRLLLALAAICAGPSRSLALDRPWDPVVLVGSALPGLVGIDPSRLVAFRSEGGWVQIPVQVDERAIVDFGTIYHLPPTGYTLLTYTDAGTFTGPDADPAFDANDELVFAAAEAGGPAGGAAEPPGTIVGSGWQLTLTDPLNGQTGFVYLFESDGSLDPGAGARPVAYNFVLLSGDYLTTYDTQQGPNPENSTVTTTRYAVHFSDRWIRNETRVTDGGATGVDLLDRHKNLFAPGNCTRSENTFSNGEGAFIVNREGPVRALRGYVGANSGPTTHRIHAFYERREEILTVLRVHPISGVMDFWDYSPAASGMVFRNDLNPGGVVVDGNPDAVALGPFVWEMVTGAQGTLAFTSRVDTDIPGFDYTSYYLDDSTPPVTQCTGDAFAYGSSGLWEDDPIPNTDPGVSSIYSRFEARRVVCYGPPQQPLAFAQQRSAEVRNPLGVAVAPYNPSPSAAGEADAGGPADRLVVRPNPARSHFEVVFRTPQAQPAMLRLVDAAGRVWRTIPVAAGVPGERRARLFIEDLPRGAYSLVLSGPKGRQEAARAILVR